MAKTSLRAYNRDIETMLDRGQVDEVVAHCLHILKTYPKHLESYRLLGKAYLEMKKYGDAVDIFSRVLVCVPNDFVAHVGMGIIRDEENKSDDAIWHMERAFETQPSNAAIQSELQRLYGRRDGVQPPRIRMTRGALAHMYVKGELYPQAISEIKSVLKEDPGRTDMQVLLARAHFKSGQRNEAAEVASSLLRRYPYCLDANAVLVELLGVDKPESVQANRQRVVELDPYAAHVNSILQTADAPESAVSIEKLDWSGQAVSLPADWRETRGISLKEGSDEEPDWLKQGLAQTETSLPSSGEAGFAMGALAQTDEEIPDFLREAGWGKSTGAFDESKSSQDADETLLPTSAAPIAASEMPDWIKDLKPAEAEQPAAAEEPMPDWMNRIDPGILPSSMENAEKEQPDWLSSLGQAESAPQPEPASADQPDWLSSLGGDLGTPAAAEASGDLDFLNSVTEQPQAMPPTATPPAMTPQAEDDAFAWLESLAVKQGSTEGLLLKPEDRSSDEPDWVKQAKELSGEPSAPAQPPASQPKIETPAAPVGNLEDLGKSTKEQDDAFAWFESLAVKQGSTEGLLMKPEDRQASEPDWVKQAKEISEPLPPAQEFPKQVKSPMDTAMWLKSLDAEEPLTETPRTSGGDDTAMWLKSLDEPEAKSESVSASAISDAAEWLKSLDEAETKPEALEPTLRSDLPAWMQEADSGAKGETAVPASETEVPSNLMNEPVESESPRLDTGSLPSWLSGLDADESKSAASDDLPAWLRDETGEVVAEPTKIQPTRAADWKPVETNEPEPVAVQQSKPAPKPVARKPAPPRKAEPQPVPESYREPAPRKSAASSPEEDPILESARSELSRSNIPGALDTYAKLIKRGRFLDEVIFDLREALYRYPVEVSICQALGDAYMRANRLQDALDAYTKAEELLR